MQTIIHLKVIVVGAILFGIIGYFSTVGPSFAKNNCSADSGDSFLDSLQDTACDIFTDGKGFSQHTSDNLERAKDACGGGDSPEVLACAYRLVDQENCILQRAVNSYDPNYYYYYSSPC